MIVSEVVNMNLSEQNTTNTELNNAQLNAAEMLANPDYKGSKTKMIKEVGVSRSTFYKWLKIPAFTDYVNNLIDKYTDAELGAVWKALISKCKTGDVQAIKLYFELKGKYKQDINVSSMATVQIINDIPKRGGTSDN